MSARPFLTLARRLIVRMAQLAGILALALLALTAPGALGLRALLGGCTLGLSWWWLAAVAAELRPPGGPPAPPWNGTADPEDPVPHPRARVGFTTRTKRHRGLFWKSKGGW